jgi:hypothetical protein
VTINKIHDGKVLMCERRDNHNHNRVTRLDQKHIQGADTATILHEVAQ